jgi:2'-5' RNA ligase
MFGQQLSFEGFGPSPKLDFVFFALLPPVEAAKQIDRLRMRLRLELGLTGKQIATERLHVSLHTVGVWHGLSRAAVRTAEEVGASFSRRPFEIVFDRAMSFARNGAFVLRARDCIALASLYHALGTDMKKAGIGKSVTSRFTPHMTLLYDDRTVAERAIEPVRWAVRDFALVHSLRGRGANRHRHLARWAMGD